jgi:DNA-binding SARP family transcriptional activator
LSLLGQWSLLLSGSREQGAAPGAAAGAAPALPGGAGRRVIAMLALRGAMTRAQARGTLWPDLGEAEAAGRLRTALWRLAAWRHTVLDERGEVLRLAPGLAVDVDEMCRAAAALRGGTDLVTWSTFEADLLPGWQDDWLIVDRERIRQTRLHALETLSSRLAAAGRFAEALDAALCALRADPLRESAHRAVIDVHLAEHNLAEAVRQYDACARVLRLELGIAPSPSLHALVAAAAATCVPGTVRDGAVTAR